MGQMSRSEYSANIELSYDPFKEHPWEMEDKKRLLESRIDPTKADRYIGQDSLGNHKYVDGSSVKVYDQVNIKNVAGKIENVVEKMGLPGRVLVAGTSGVVAVGSSAVDAETFEEFTDNMTEGMKENRYVSASMAGDHFKLAEMGAQDIAIAAAGVAAGAAALTISAPAIVVGALAVGGAVAVGYGVEKLIDYGQSIDFVEVGQDIGDAVQSTMTKVGNIADNIKDHALKMSGGAQALASDVADGVSGAFDSLKDEYQNAGGVSGMFNSAASSVKETFSNMFNREAEGNTYTGTIDRSAQPMEPVL